MCIIWIEYQEFMSQFTSLFKYETIVFACLPDAHRALRNI